MTAVEGRIFLSRWLCFSLNLLNSGQCFIHEVGGANRASNIFFTNAKIFIESKKKKKKIWKEIFNIFICNLEIFVYNVVA